MNEPNKNQIPIESCSVKVMRSYDYCHFEICLSSTLQPIQHISVEDPTGITPAQIDALRKAAARLADKAVEQYKIAKAAAVRDRGMTFTEEETKAVETIRRIPDACRTPEEQARLKAYADALFHANREYDYQDDWDQEDQS